MSKVFLVASLRENFWGRSCHSMGVPLDSLMIGRDRMGVVLGLLICLTNKLTVCKSVVS